MLSKAMKILGVGGEAAKEDESTASRLTEDPKYYATLLSALSPTSQDKEDEDFPRAESTMSQKEMAVADYKNQLHIEELLTTFVGDWLKKDLDNIDIATQFQKYIADNPAVDSTQKDRLERKQKECATRFALRARYNFKNKTKGDAVSGRAPRVKADLYPEIDLVNLSDIVDIKRLLAAFDEYDKQLEASETETGRMKSIPRIDPDIASEATTVFDHILARFFHESHKRKYGFTQSDLRQKDLHAGEHVPSYFANVKDQSIHRRKVLSLAGLRNLIKYGPEIYEEFQKKLFSGDPESYSSNEGMGKMRNFTGNVVDLDTCVLRASDPVTLKTINAYNECQKIEKWSDAAAFGESKQAEEIAKTAATTMITQFVNDFELSEAAARDRKIDVSQITSPIPIASNNTDRGKWPVWHYVNVGQNSFHANVPTIPDVTGALLKAPFRCAKIYLHLHAFHSGEALESKLAAFYEDAVADSCFNMKWKALEEFSESLKHEGTILDVLQKIQAANQSEISAIMDEDDENYTKEKAKMVELAEGKFGKTADGTVRPITASDVERWVDDPATVF
eukprot:TRINITY_DN4819_c5_g1_i1.p1 TRINITY_DN4819_c5_g1~~TRINITY_DN4819_c5_g1_i1.p1  ORF type:complete len:564 (+),score=149.57 TRINITY_DN4819_c5_g1_i1:47-1738(+)